MIFDSLDWWCDPILRDGPSAMAVDEWLLEHVTRPTLRVYGWDGNWGSVGYFGSMDLAREQIPDRNWVRRWTGGGVVDHVRDWTYTVIVPKTDPVASMRGGESYRALHAAVAVALQREGLAVTSSDSTASTDEVLCFRNPVSHDLLLDGRKVAGAGQRRNRTGLLHQGSLALPCGEMASCERARALALALSAEACPIELDPLPDEIRRRAENYEVYWMAGWTDSSRFV